MADIQPPFGQALSSDVWNSACASWHPHLTWSQRFSTKARKMLPYGPSTSVRSSWVRGENLAIVLLDSVPRLRDELQLYCLTATPYLQDNCYMLPTVENNQVLSSRVIVKLKLTTNTWHRWLPSLPPQFCSCCSAGKRAGGRHSGLLQNPLFFSQTGKDHLHLSPPQAFLHLWPSQGAGAGKWKPTAIKQEEQRREALTRLKTSNCSNRGRLQE